LQKFWWEKERTYFSLIGIIEPSLLPVNRDYSFMNNPSTADFAAWLRWLEFFSLNIRLVCLARKILCRLASQQT